MLNQSEQHICSHHQHASITYILLDPRNFPQIHYLGPRNIVCQKCRALHFENEKDVNNTTSFNSCCRHGLLFTEPLPALPEYLHHLLTDDDPVSRHFCKNIVGYNNAMAFTPYMWEKSEHLNHASAYQTFVVKSEVYHLHSSLEPWDTRRIPAFAQTYLYNPEQATEYRLTANETLNEQVLWNLAHMMESCHNPFINIYRSAREYINTERPGPFRFLLQSLSMNLIVEKGSDQRCTNLPTSNEIAAIIPDIPEGPAY